MISWIRHRFHPLWHLRRTTWFRALQRHLDFPVTVRNGRIQQHVMFLRDFSYVVPHHDAEARSRSCFLNLLRCYKPEFFLDVGANVGSYSWTAINTDPSLAVWLFEPDERNLQLLKKTIQSNQLVLTRIFPVAVTAKKGQVEFLIDEASGATGSIEDHTSHSFSFHSQYHMQKRIEVNCECLDSFVEELKGHRVVIKIDVEGAEDQVFAGARRVLELVRPVIIVECFAPEKMSLLKELGYQIHDLQEGCNWLAVPIECAGELQAVCPASADPAD
jgi:FkbM family methyltransferase